MLREFGPTPSVEISRYLREMEAKRRFDLVAGAAMVAYVAPKVPKLLTQSAIETRSNGIFRQRRVDRDVENLYPDLNLLKVRTMRKALAGELVSIKGPKDSRAAGMHTAEMRHRGQDEELQAFQVLSGVLSVVAIRPLMPESFAQYEWSARKTDSLATYTRWLRTYGLTPKGCFSPASLENHKNTLQNTAEGCVRLMEMDLEFARRDRLALDIGVVVNTATTLLFEQAEETSAMVLQLQAGSPVPEVVELPALLRELRAAA